MQLNRSERRAQRHSPVTPASPSRERENLWQSVSKSRFDESLRQLSSAHPPGLPREKQQLQRRVLRDEPLFAAEDFLAFAAAGLDLALGGGGAVFRDPFGAVFS